MNQPRWWPADHPKGGSYCSECCTADPSAQCDNVASNVPDVPGRQISAILGDAVFDIAQFESQTLTGRHVVFKLGMQRIDQRDELRLLAFRSQQYGHLVRHEPTKRMAAQAIWSARLSLAHLAYVYFSKSLHCGRCLAPHSWRHAEDVERQILRHGQSDVAIVGHIISASGDTKQWRQCTFGMEHDRPTVLHVSRRFTGGRNVQRRRTCRHGVSRGVGPVRISHGQSSHVKANVSLVTPPKAGGAATGCSQRRSGLRYIPRMTAAEQHECREASVISVTTSVRNPTVGFVMRDVGLVKLSTMT